MDTTTHKEFNIDDFIKPGHNMVVELDDEIEYLLDEEAIAMIKNNEANIFLKRLGDGHIVAITREKIITALDTDGLVDYLEI